MRDGYQLSHMTTYRAHAFITYHVYVSFLFIGALIAILFSASRLHCLQPLEA